MDEVLLGAAVAFGRLNADAARFDYQQQREGVACRPKKNGPSSRRPDTAPFARGVSSGAPYTSRECMFRAARYKLNTSQRDPDRHRQKSGRYPKANRHSSQHRKEQR